MRLFNNDNNLKLGSDRDALVWLSFQGVNLNSNIESIEISTTTINVYGIDCLLQKIKRGA